MTIQDGDLHVSRRVVAGLRTLRAKAPANLAAGTLHRVGTLPAYAVMSGPLGEMFVAYGQQGILSITRAGDPVAFEEAFLRRFGRPVRRVPAPPARLATAIGRLLEGRTRVSPHVDLSELSPFEQAVLRKTAEIPRGEVRPYAWIAREIGRPAAVRAVGTALATNPVPLVIPCHRVVRSDGSIGQYGWGSDRKRALLAQEGLDTDELEGMARRGERYVGSDTTGVFCYPSCHNARRISPGHRVSFGSLAQGLGAGYRPCRSCRPAPVEVAAA